MNCDFASVVSSTENAVRRNWDCAPPFLLFLYFPLFLFVASMIVHAQTPAGVQVVTLDDAVHQLVERVATIQNLHGPVRVQYFQGMTPGRGEDTEWQQLLRKELESLRIAVTEDSTANVLRVGLTETPTELVLAAGIRLNEKVEARFVTLPRTAVASSGLPVAPVRIEKQLIYQTPDRIVDAAGSIEGGESELRLLAYRGNELVVTRVDSAGKAKQVVSLAPAGVRITRDSRGELTANASQATVALPGKICQVSWAPGGDAKCHASKPVWRTAVVLTPACGDGGWRLLSDGGDWSTPDLLQVVPDGIGRKGSTALLSDFPGPILSIAAGPSSGSALVVTRNLPTGDYEIYKITLACGD